MSDNNFRLAMLFLKSTKSSHIASLREPAAFWQMTSAGNLVAVLAVFSINV
jgi:hypothetical protein